MELGENELEQIIIAAYRRGAEWIIENELDHKIGDVKKASLDYADKTIHVYKNCGLDHAEGSDTMKIFLGGTCNNSTWRNSLIPALKIDYFNPVVEDWTPECQNEEIRQRQVCDIVLYVITQEMTGVYSIAEAVDDSNKRPEKTIFCFLKKGFSEAQTKSLYAVGNLIRSNGGRVANDLEDVALIANNWQSA